ncbi:MAG: N-formylglutamate amidohydrolase [Gammaproteobacteria bacterium]|nr:N-formylglutamate amidohydrolase [Gammaproteobacteria bacterium]
MNIFITCEHGGNEIPLEFDYLFENAHSILLSHEGWDIGALQLANAFFAIADFDIYSTVSRLVVDLNRSPHHPKLFSSFTQPLTKQEKTHILAQYYYPYRTTVLNAIGDKISRNEKVVHLSVHSFTSVLNEKERQTDIGLLYDPQRNDEKILCDAWRREINLLQPDFRVRFNYPYLGKADGFVTFLRKQFSPAHYIGLEIEVNQKIMQNEFKYQIIEPLLLKSFAAALASFKTIQR